MSLQQSTGPRFFQLCREIIWPIYGAEHKGFLPMAIINTLILANYTIIRSIKDATIITTSGVETITFIKFWLVVPCSFLFFLLYAKAVNLFTRDQLFYGIILGFLSFFILFSWGLYPYRHLLHPTSSADWLQSVMPQAQWASYVVDIYRYWTLSLFYVVAEMWSSVMLSFIFWQLANSVTAVKDAKRFYTHFYLLAHISVFAAGLAVSSIASQQSSTTESWQILLQNLMAIVCISCVVIIAMYWALHRFVFNGKHHVPGFTQIEQTKVDKPKMSLWESIRFLVHSPYLALIATLVLCYGISTNLVEILWKNQLKLQYPNPQDYAAFMGKLYMIVGLATCIVILVGGSILRHLGWKKAALVTPIALGGGGLLFCLGLIFTDSMQLLSKLLHITPLVLLVCFGTLQYVLGKSTKYALFDPTKEMTYIPLDEESKTKGKAAIDVFGTRFGKSCGGFIQQLLFIFVGPVSVIAPYSFCILFAMTALWVWAVSALHKRFAALNAE
ncbi:MAG: Npt1/Npt2 family nucleotide transporter [Myxococcota bacterium]